MKSLFYISAVLALVSCRTQLPEQYYKKSLVEDNYIDHKKNTYTLHLTDASSISKLWIQNTKDTVTLEKKDTTNVFKKQRSRPYFDLVTKADTTILSNRYITFKKTVNFRDIGGIKTKNGTTTKWGMIYRSDNLSKLKDSEFDAFNDLNIKTVFDLRTPNEIKGKEDNLPQGTHYVHAPTVEDNADMLTQMRGKVIRGEISGEQSLQFMTSLYRSIISDNIPGLRKFINQVLDADEPVLYHCSAGKDRTGVTTALILSILNVERQTIVNEYLLSNYYRRDKTERIIRMAKVAKVIKPHLGITIIQNFMGVDERYINAAFDEIDSRYGGIDNYIKNQLGIDDDKHKLIIKKFTY